MVNTIHQKITAQELVKLAVDIHTNENAKWWVDSNGNFMLPPIYQSSMLILSELSEAMEGVRKNLMDDKLPHHTMFNAELSDVVIRLLDTMVGFCPDMTFTPFDYFMVTNTQKPVEFLETVARYVVKMFDPVDGAYTNPMRYLNIVYYILDYCITNEIDIFGIVEEKRTYNKDRLDHTLAQRSLENGKKF